LLSWYETTLIFNLLTHSKKQQGKNEKLFVEFLKWQYQSFLLLFFSVGWSIQPFSCAQNFLFDSLRAAPLMGGGVVMVEQE
jgi:hypothetical protein